MGQAERLWRWCRRNPVVAGLGAGLTAALLAGTAISLTFGLRERQERIRAEQAEGVAVAAQDDLEQTLARSLVRPLNPEGNNTLNEPEAEALWELAEKPGERLWLRFVTETLRSPRTVMQLRRRAEPAWIAAVGLDLEKRKHAEQGLIEKLDTADLNDRQKYDLAISALTLEDLTPASLQKMVDILVASLASEFEYVEQQQVVYWVVEATKRLQSDASAGIVIAALEKTLTTAAGPKSGLVIATLPVGVSSMIGRLGPEQAERVLTPVLEKQAAGNARYVLAQGLAAMGGRMEPAEAERVLTRALEKETNVNARNALAQGLAAVAGRMKPAEAARVAGQAASFLTRALEKERDAWLLDRLAYALAAVTGRMEPAEAARVAGRAADILTRALEKERSALGRNALAKGLAALAGRLSRGEAATVSRRVLKTQLQAADMATDEINRLCLVGVVTSLLSASDSIDASQAAAKLSFAVCSDREVNSNNAYELGFDPTGPYNLDALLTDDSRSEVSRRTVAVATVVGLVSATPFPALPVLPSASKPLPCRLSTQDLVELLKMPTCFGEARKVVLKHLGNRYGRTFANHWEFVRYAQEQHLNLDLLSPPKRPKRP